MNNTLIFIRHAETKVDKSTPIEKWILTVDGFAAAQELGTISKFNDIDIIISSDEEKAYLTIEPLADKVKKKVIRIPGLGEIKRPNSEKLSLEEYEYMKYKIFTDLDYTKHGWETANHALERFKKSVEKINKDYEGRKILICAHGTVLTLYFASLQNQMNKLFLRWKNIDFGSYGIIRDNKVVRDITKKKRFGAFAIVCIELIVGIGVLGALFSFFILPNISSVTGTSTVILQSYLQTILTFGGIFIPLVLLVFFELAKQPVWKNYPGNKTSSKILIAILLISALFIFSALSLGAVNTTPALIHAIESAYSGVGIALMVLIALILLYVEIY